MSHDVSKHLGATVHDDGVDFAVWAPFAQAVDLLVSVEFDWQEVAMQSDKKGYWFVKDVAIEVGQSYKFQITTASGEKLEKNDPYARQLTDSDIGSSVIVAHDYEWGDASAYVKVTPEDAIIYELHIGTFHRLDASTPGTFYTAIEKLDYLAELGVTYVELMPVTSMATSHGWGYAPNYIFSVENAYGGRRGLMDFVKACHERGIGVLLDIVYNHFYDDTDLWQYDGWSENDNGGIYFYNDERGKTPWGGRPDYGRPEVRQFILDNVAMWLNEYKIDGLRVDSTIFMRNTEGKSDTPEHDIADAWSLLADMSKLARKINPSALLIAEDNASTAGLVLPVNDGGTGFTAQWEVGFPHVIRDSLGITTNGQQPRLEGISYELGHTYSGSSFDKVIFSDSHDTAANGSVRLNEAVTPGNAASVSAQKRVLLASAVTLTAPGIPMLLQGQEFMQEGAFNDWQMLDWGLPEKHAGIVLAHHHLIDLRRNTFDNTRGLRGEHTEIFHRDDKNTVLGYLRRDQSGPLDDTLVIVNFGDAVFTEYAIQLPTDGAWRVRFDSSWKGYSQAFHESESTLVTTDGSGAATMSLPAYSVQILSKD